MNAIAHLLILFVWLTRTRVSSFNIEDRDPIMKRAKEEERGSYFGFSVAQHAVEEQSRNIADYWILVGAPRGKNLQPGVEKSGALFKCPITRQRNDCVQVETDGKRLQEFDYDDDVQPRGVEPLLPPGNDEIKKDQWLGVTVRSQKPGGKVMICAHRYIKSRNLTLHQYGMGLCYLLSNHMEAEECLLPCEGRPTEEEHRQYGYCQVGTSLAILDDGFALMGSPGPFTWRGTIFAQEVVGDFLSKDNTVYKGPLNDDPKPIDKYSYLGMSATGGRFFEKTLLSYVAGAPRAEFKGMVYFFSKKRSEEDMNITKTIVGEQFASSFGYELLSVDVNEDGFDDLLVAAPFYYNKDEGGAVYVFDNLRACHPSTNAVCKHSSVLTGKRESQFGLAMTSLGDVNKDGYADVAIGAPYEDGGGAIYIYLGSADGLSREPSQVIRHPGKGITTLGYSLSGGLDMDLNDYPDLVTGAYDSDLVLLYKTRPIIDIAITISGKELRNIDVTKKGCAADPDTNKTCFSFQSCFRLSKFKFDRAFNVKFVVKELPKKIPRVTFNDQVTEKYFSIRKGDYEKSRCYDLTAYLMERNGDILSPIKFVVNYSLQDNSIDSPILNKTSVKEFEATFQKNCGDDDICKSVLVLEAATSLEKTDEGYTLDLGKRREFQLDANVTNLGESAYEAKLFVFHPDAISYVALQTEKNKTSNVVCTSNNETTVVTCNLGNPLQGNKTLNLRLRFEIKDTKQQRLNITVFVNSTSVELSRRTRQSFTAILHKVAHYTIRGISPTGNVFFTGEVKGQSAMRSLEDIGPKVHHVYDVTNNGQWAIRDVQVVIWWPYQVYSDRPEGGKWLLYLERNPMIDQSPINNCVVEPSEALNPLRLNSSGLEEEAGETGTRRRRKRDADDVVASEMKSDNDGKQRRVVTMDCEKRTATCAKIICTIPKLMENSQIKIRIFSRIWNSTLVEDYSNVDWVSIMSKGEVFIENMTAHSNTSVRSDKVETVAYPGIVVTDTGLNIWIIVGSVLAGLIVLIILIIILYKLGFFKRNRIKDHTLSGNLRKQGENETLLKEGESKPTKSTM